MKFAFIVAIAWLALLAFGQHAHAQSPCDDPDYAIVCSKDNPFSSARNVIATAPTPIGQIALLDQPCYSHPNDSNWRLYASTGSMGGCWHVPRKGDKMFRFEAFGSMDLNMPPRAGEWPVSAFRMVRR